MERDTFPLGCYGKLPFWPEYLKENVSFPSSRKLVAWIHEGRSEASLAASQEDPGQAEPPAERARVRILYGEPGATEIVAGVIRPSADQGGLRKFPFVVLTHLPRRLFAGSYPLLPLALAPVWEALDEAWDRLASVASKEAFQEIAGSHRVPSPLPPREVEQEYRGRQQETMSVLGRGDGISLEILARNMPELLGRIRKDPATFRVELPVSPDPGTACLDASFWIDLLNAQFRFRRVEPAVFLDEDPGSRSRKVLLILPPLAAGDYPAVMHGSADCPGVLRPAQGPEVGGGEDPASPREVTYAEMLARRF